MSKSLIVAAGILAVGIVSATAADLMPVKAPPIVVDPPISWSGFYLGGDLGASWGRGQSSQVDTTTTTTTTSSVTELTVNGTPIVGPSPFPTPPGTFPQTTGPTTSTAAAIAAFTSGKASVNGFMGGAQAGYRQQFSTWVLGLEGDIEGSTESGSFSTCSAVGCPVGSGIGAADFRLRWLSTLRGTVGFLVHPRILLYGTGGLAVGGVDVDYLSGINGGSFTTGGLDTTLVGYAIGGGVEGKIDQHWSVRGQYLFVDLGSFSTNLGPGAAVTNTTIGVVTTNFPQPLPPVTNIPIRPIVNTVTTTTTTTSSSTAAQIRSRLRDRIIKIAFNYQF